MAVGLFGRLTPSAGLLLRSALCAQAGAAVAARAVTTLTTVSAAPALHRHRRPASVSDLTAPVPSFLWPDSYAT
ncbi:hypothetical protein GCM10010532_071900 [Dactylosporangium siamense]